MAVDTKTETKTTLIPKTLMEEARLKRWQAHEQAEAMVEKLYPFLTGHEREDQRRQFTYIFLDAHLETLGEGWWESQKIVPVDFGPSLLRKCINCENRSFQVECESCWGKFRP